MTSWESLKDVVASALELPLAERSAFLSQSGLDKGLLSEAIALATFDVSDSSQRLLDRRADAFMGIAGANPAGLVGKQLGKYTLRRLVGQGGMGAVYLAMQHGVDRNVAVKVVPPHALMFDARSRFEREIQALGRIDHPGVARVYDSGLHLETSPPGLAPIPYFAMEWVEGQPLTKHVSTYNLSLNARVQLMIGVADAVQAAHQRAVVHCDLKPANVLVLPPNATNAVGSVKVVDFGLARLMETGVGNVTAVFSSSSVMGTLAYMAPEQARGDQHEVGFQTDVYALGVLLYEIVHGVLPVDTKGLPLTETLRRLSDPDVLERSVVDDFTGGDLASVLSVALAPEKQRRYSSVEAFADDLRRLLRCEPVVAQPATSFYKARKFMRRNRLGVLAAVGILAALVTGSAVATVGLLRERSAHLDADAATQVANRERAKAESARDFLRYIVSSAAPGESGRDVTVVDAVRAALPTIEKFAGGDPAAESDLRLTVATTLRELGYGDEALAEYARAYELACVASGPASEQAIGIAIEQAGTLANVGQLDAAQHLLTSLPERISGLHDRQSMARANAMLDEARANLLVEQSDYEGAALVYEDILSRCANIPDLIDDDELENWQLRYALVLSYAGRLRDAEKTQREIVERYIRVYGPNHVSTLVAQQNLSGTLVDLGEFDEARALLDHVIVVGTSIWGAEHPDLLATRRSLAALEFTRGDYRAAVEIAEAVLTDGRKIYPPDAPFLLLAENVYSAALMGEHNWEQGIPAARALIAKLARVYGPTHPSTLANRASLAQALGMSGDRPAAIDELREVLPLQKAAMGETAYGALITQSNLGMFELQSGNTQVALELLASSLAGATDAEFLPLVPQFRRNLGKAMTAVKRFDDAEDALLTAYEEMVERLSETEQRKTARIIADLYTAWERADEASRWSKIAGNTD